MTSSLGHTILWVGSMRYRNRLPYPHFPPAPSITRVSGVPAQTLTGVPNTVSTMLQLVFEPMPPVAARTPGANASRVISGDNSVSNACARQDAEILFDGAGKEQSAAMETVGRKLSSFGGGRGM